MKLEEMKNASFAPYTLGEWAAKAEESLKGRKIESLSTSTYETIELKPFYSKEDIDPSSMSQFPGAADFRRGAAASGYYQKAWYVANKFPYANLDELEAKVKAGSSAGQTAFAIEAKEILFSDETKLEELLHEYSAILPFSVNTKGFLKPFLDRVVKALNKKNQEISGFIATDLIGEAALNGGFSREEAQIFAEWEQVVRSANLSLPNIKTILVDTSIYHNGGANAVQELGVAVATGVFYVQSLLDSGWELHQALKNFIFHFSIGSNFFMETAKLRAARILWDKAMEAYGAEEELRKMEISAETSQFTKTVFDPYVNLLRAGNEAFSAVLGGVQYLSVNPLDEADGQSSAFSERIARNTQLILKAEAHLEKVADPSGGSWYIETLTRELAEKAWEYFLAIEDQGGMLEALKSNWLQNSISDVKAQRDKDAFTRKQSIIGTNVYANIAEKVNQQKEVDEKQLASQFKPITARRLSEPFEELRYKAGHIEAKTGVKPSVGLICLGALKQHKARADFITGFLASGGIVARKSTDINDGTTALGFIQATDLKHYCICGDHRQYDENGIELVKEILRKFPDVQISMAGIPSDTVKQAYLQAGVQQFWQIKSNHYETLSTLLKEMEVSIDEKQA